MDRDSLTSETGKLPDYIAIEGPIGVGKTTLAKRLAGSFNYDTLLEQPEQNPFLERFYGDPRRYALQTELFFLFQRAEQLQSMRQSNLFERVRISDFLMEKNRLFAQVNLHDDEFLLYENVYRHLTLDAPTPDLVIYLQAPVPVLRERILKRGLLHEKYISDHYLTRLHEAYTEFFHYYDAAPLMIVNASDLDLASSTADYQQLIKCILENPRGRHYFNPLPLTD